MFVCAQMMLQDKPFVRSTQLDFTNLILFKQSNNLNRLNLMCISTLKNSAVTTFERLANLVIKYL